MKINALSIAWAAIAIGLFTLGAAGSARVIWSVDLETGRQSHERYVFGLPIKAISDYNRLACPDWQNPRPGQSGEVVLGVCKLLFGCEYNNLQLLEAGCAE